MVFRSCLHLNIVAGYVNGFTPKPLQANQNRPTLIPMSMDYASIQEIKSARAAFVLCFFGAAGAASIGREVLPKTWAQWQKICALKGKGQSLGGEEMGLFGYPESVYSNDVLQVLNNKMNIVDIIKKYPVEGKLPGYLQFESIAQANDGVSLMAVRAVFDSLTLGINTNQVWSEDADKIFEIYKTDFGKLKKNNQLAKMIGISAFVVLLGLVGIGDYFALFHLLHGWFPEWPGLTELPASFFDDRGIVALPNYFVNDLPVET